MTYDPQDLEVIVTSLEIAALTLTDVAGRTFSRRELFDEARKMIPEIVEEDMKITFAGMRCFAKTKEGWCLR